MNTDPIVTVFAKRIRLARDSRRWSSRVMAERAGISAATVCRAESGERDMWLTVAIRIAAALEIPLSELVALSTCERCDGTPPAGFICADCRREGSA